MGGRKNRFERLALAHSRCRQTPHLLWSSGFFISYRRVGFRRSGAGATPGVNPFDAASLQRVGERVERGASRHHVVDDGDVAVG